MKYYTADLHFFHKRIVEMTGRDTTQENHDKWVVDVINDTCKQHDHLYILGDVSFSNKARTEELLAKLECTYTVIAGNHDHWIPEKDRVWYAEHRNDDLKVRMCHFPMASWADQRWGSVMLHGHSHGNYQGEGRILDVGLDSAIKVLGRYRPFSESDVAFLMGSRPVSTVDRPL